MSDHGIGLTVEDWLDACDRVEAAKAQRAGYEAKLGELVPRDCDAIEFVHRRLIPSHGGWQVIRVSRTRGGQLLVTASPIPGSGDVRWPEAVPVLEFAPPAVADAACCIVRDDDGEAEGGAA
jgi:hypothetical protein